MTLLVTVAAICHAIYAAANLNRWRIREIDERQRVWLIDIDGTICDDVPNEEAERFETAEPLHGALDMVRALHANGDRVCFFTARAQEHAEVTEEWLERHGFEFEAVIYNKPRIEQGQVYCWVDNKPVEARFTPSGIAEL